MDFEGEEKALRELATEPKNERFKELMEEELRPRPRSTPDQEEEKKAVEDNTTEYCCWIGFDIGGGWLRRGRDGGRGAIERGR